MTTAARPTFDPAKGGSGFREKGISSISQQVSSRDLPGHLSIKERKPGQGTNRELKRKDFGAELEERERIAKLEDDKDGTFKFVPSLEQAIQMKLDLKAEKMKEKDVHRNVLLDGSIVEDDKSPEQTNFRQLAQLDVDEDFGEDNLSSDFEEDDDDDDDNDDEDEDDPAELMAELNRIKRERAAEEEKQQERIDNNTDCSSAVDEYSEASFKIKRRWDDDVPFKNCARPESDTRKKSYLNDTLRQEFHRKFMDKYIR